MKVLSSSHPDQPGSLKLSSQSSNKGSGRSGSRLGSESSLGSTLGSGSRLGSMMGSGSGIGSGSGMRSGLGLGVAAK